MCIRDSSTEATFIKRAIVSYKRKSFQQRLDFRPYFRKMGVAIKKDSRLLAAVSLLIGLSTCFTGNVTVGYYMNRLALILLFLSLIHI